MNGRLFGLCAVLLLTADGCATPRSIPPPQVDAPASSQLAAVRRDLTDSIVQLIDDSQFPLIAGPSSEAPARNVLLLSGGGKDGAYSAGVLAGWSAAGTRPSFDVVTGVSTGALLAPLAFLGPRCDRLLTERYTNVRTADIYRRRSYLAVLWSESLADSTPLKHIIEEQITDALLAEIAKAHQAGRRLYVGTTNLDTGRLVLWDMGAIAEGAAPRNRELFQKILLASCSIPGLLPPVPVEIEVNGQRYTELHVDGGVSASMFLAPYMVVDDPCGARPNVYVIVAGKLSLEPRSVERRFVALSGAALEDLLNAHTRTDLLRVFLLTRLAGGRFAVTSVPQEFQENQDQIQFEPNDMRRLFDAGYERAVGGTAWRSSPPGVNPEEWPWPRSGTQFNVARNNP